MNSQKKLEDLCLVRDASSKQEKYVNGYKVCEYVALTPKEKSPISLYNKKSIFVRDRGYDANVFFTKDIKEDNKFVTRLKTNRNLIFKDLSENAFEKVRKRKGKIKTKLMYKGENRNCYLSYTKVKLPACRKKEVYLVTVHGLKDDIDDDSNKYGEDNVIVFLTAVMLKLSMYIEKIGKNILSIIIVERAMALEDNCKVWFGRMSQGIYEILKFARRGIKEWQNIERRSKYPSRYQQLELELI